MPQTLENNRDGHTDKRPPSSGSRKLDGLSRNMAANNSQEGRRNSWLGLSRSKKKYNFRNQPTYSEPPDENPNDKVFADKRDIPTLLERLDSQEHQNSEELVVLQKTVIHRLVEENKSLKTQNSQIDVLKIKNLALQEEVKNLKDNRTMQDLLNKDKVEQNGVNVADTSTTTNTVVESLTKEIRDLKAENSRMKIVNDQLKYAKEQLQVALDHQSRSMKDSQGNVPHSSQNGFTQVNGHQHPPPVNKGIHSRGSSRSSYSSPAVSTCTDEIEVLDDEEDADSGYPTSENQYGYGGATNGRSNGIRTVPAVVKVSGVLHHCDEILIERVRFNLRSRHFDLDLEDWTKTHTIGKLCFVFCLKASRLGTDVDNALQGISDEAEVVLVVMHHIPYQPKRGDPQSEGIIGKRDNICLVVDMFFFEKAGLYECEQNDKALAKIVRLFEMLC